MADGRLSTPGSSNTFMRPGTGDTGFQFLGDKGDLFTTQLRIHRQGQELLRTPFRHGERAFAVTERTIGVLKVNRHRVMNGAGNLLLGQLPQDLIATLHPDSVNMIDVLMVRGLERRDYLVETCKKTRVK